MRHCRQCGNEFGVVRRVILRREFCSTRCLKAYSTGKPPWLNGDAGGVDDRLNRRRPRATMRGLVAVEFRHRKLPRSTAGAARVSVDEDRAAIWTVILRAARQLGKHDSLWNGQRPSVVQLRKGTAGPPVYFIGAGLWEYHLAQLVQTRCPIFAIEVAWPSAWRIAAAKNEAAALPSMEQLVARYVAALSSHARSSPCVLAGISFGGLMAFEAAHQLNRRGGNVEMVMLLDAQAQYPAPRRVAWQRLRKDWRRRPDTTQDHDESETIASRLGNSWSVVRWIFIKEMKQLRSRLLYAVLGDLGPLTPKFDDLGVPLRWRLVERLYLNALRSYRARRLDCRGILFRADPEDERVVRALDVSLGWKNLFGRGLKIIQMTGDHLTMVWQRPHDLALAREMSRLLNEFCAAPAE